MTSIQIKNKLKSKIDKVDDKKLMRIKEAINDIIKNEKLDWNSLKTSEKKSILTGLKQLENGDYILYEDLRREMNGWKRKLRSQERQKKIQK